MSQTIKTSTKLKASTRKTVDFDTAVSSYYKLKHDYQRQINKVVKELYNNTTLTMQEKHQKFLDTKKKCIKCGKSGGTIFSETANLLTAKCGNTESPCRLDIQLEKATYNNIIDVMELENKQVNNYKNNIITTKLDYMFGFKNQADTLQKFEELKNDLVKIVKSYQEHTQKYIDTIYNLSNISKINSLNSQLDGNILSFKDLIDNFNREGDIQYIKDAVELYVNTIKIVNTELNSLRYKLQEIYKDKDTNISYLIQKTYTLSQLQLIKSGTENKIIAFSI